MSLGSSPFRGEAGFSLQVGGACRRRAVGGRLEPSGKIYMASCFSIRIVRSCPKSFAN